VRVLRVIVLGVGLLALPSAAASQEAQGGAIGFDSELWTVRAGQVVEHLGREAFAGFAYLDGVDLTEGVVEVDLAVNGRTSYPGIVFRMASERDFEHVYVRPHRAGQYPDAAQYAHNANGISSWQLCNGDGYTAPVELPTEEWVRLRLEFAGTQAVLYVGESDEPALHVKQLRLEEGGGTIGLRGPADGTAYFSNFSYSPNVTVEFRPVPAVEVQPGIITTWGLSQAFQMDAVDLERPSDAQDLPEITWARVECDPDGLVDVSRHTGRTGPKPDCVFARTVIDATESKTLRLEFGYSDAVSVFLNGELLFTGSSAYRQRDPTFLGIIGYFDAVYLPLVEGENTLEFLVVESFGGWGLMARDGNATFLSGGVERFAECGELRTPECVVHDPDLNVFYVSNFDAYRSSSMLGGQFVSLLSEDGAVIDASWVGGLRMPTGMALNDGLLYVVERGGLVEVDVADGAVVGRRPIEGAAFPNDITIADDGTFFVSDSAGSIIYRSVDGGFEAWLQGDEVSGPNAVLADGGRLVFGNSGDSSVKAVDLSGGEIETLARFRSGTIDGIQAEGDGAYLVSHNEGRVYRLSPDGSVTRLIDTTVTGERAADFAYLPEEGLVVVPTFYTDSVVIYRVSD
jgi:sugar lactone lactonase YvrE